MRNLMFLVIVLLMVVLVGCGGNSSAGQKPTVTTGTASPGINPQSETDKLVAKWEEEKRLKAEKEAITKSKEIPVGDETFQKLVNYIVKNGFAIYEGKSKQYTFFDSRGNRHAYLALGGGPKGDGNVDTIVVYGYYKGIKKQEYFFPYDISREKVFNSIPDLDGGWEDFEATSFGYNEFLKKVTK